MTLTTGEAAARVSIPAVGDLPAVANDPVAQALFVALSAGLRGGVCHASQSVAFEVTEALKNRHRPVSPVRVKADARLTIERFSKNKKLLARDGGFDESAMLRRTRNGIGP
ncbi:hypothetical protein [Paraburkholderia phymatum]|uniref:hypothetical protein n=1 Tax=Paraburkholderia phymatum TaxID=148447 RepID=UPI0034D38BE4